ncbi:MAG: L,D-transpeptidase family protein [Alphaproteobacteria bacterium]
MLICGAARFRCALGRAGITDDKREGDGATPVGDFALRRVLYRADRLPRPRTRLPVCALTPRDGWCDDPNHPAYNRPVRLPFAGHREHLWRGDRLYDLIVVLGHNDDPVHAGRGSAVFVHVAAPDFAATAGCVAVAASALLRVLRRAGPETRLRVCR